MTARTTGPGRRAHPTAVLAAALALAVSLGAAGCGVPARGEPTRIPASEVPYGLASPTPTAPRSPEMDTMLLQAGIFLVGPDDVLVPRGREMPGGEVVEQLGQLLDQLAVGPSRQELAEELSTALPPEIELRVTDVSDGTATIDLSGPGGAPTGEESRLAVAQIVLTATSLPAVQAVRLTQAGQPVDAPLPDGELTSAPLTAEAFASVLTPSPTPTPTSVPAAPPAPSTEGSAAAPPS